MKKNSVTLLSSQGQIRNDQAFDLNWREHSENYVAGITPNGCTVLASRPAVSVSLMVSSDNRISRLKSKNK